MISLNLNIFIAQLLTFLVALFIVWKVSWGPLVSMMKSRKEKILQDIDSAEMLKKDAQGILDDYQKKLEHLAREKERILSATREEAELAKNDIVKAAQLEVNELREKVLMELRDEKSAIVKELRGEIINTAMQLSEKVLEENAKNIIQKTKYEQMLEYLEKTKTQGNVSHGK